MLIRNAIGEGVLNFLSVTSSVVTIATVLVAFFKGRLKTTKPRKFTIIYPNGFKVPAENYTATEFAEVLAKVPSFKAEEDKPADPALRPDFGVIEGFAAKPKRTRKRRSKPG